MEVLLSLAIIGLIAAVLVGGGAQLLNDRPVSPAEVFWSAVQEARKMALKSERDVSLRFANDKDKGKIFIVSNGESTKELPVPAAGDLEFTFHSQQKGGNLIMVAGTVIETAKIESVTFYADGTCSAFRAQIFRNGSAQMITVDPWTCAPVLTPTDPNNLRP